MSLQKKSTTAALTLGALGIVYGDIGTSPLYALKSCFLMSHVTVTADNIFGIISLFLWSLILMIYLKYICLVMRFDSQGEGGILILSSLCAKLKTSYRLWGSCLGIIGATLFFGDGILTPAISILSALEGLHLMLPISTNSVMYLSLLVLTVLILIQKHGSSKIGAYFGPVMLAWFALLSLLGIYSIAHYPMILKAINPYYAITFFMNHGVLGLLALGGTILVLTGAEALYADMGHFGKKAIRLSWNVVVFPSLALNYLGQGALLVQKPQAIENPFYLIAPSFLHIPMILFSTIATIIASQAVISGIFSIVKQAVMLNLLPRMKILHTSTTHIGQVYIPVVNGLLYVVTMMCIYKFKTSSSLSVAYGCSVAGVMLVTTLLLLILTTFQEKWSWISKVCVFIPLLLLDGCFFITNVIKIFEGAWITILITLCALYVIWVWKSGKKALLSHHPWVEKNLATYFKEKSSDIKIPGVGMFLTDDINHIPLSLDIHLQHHQFLHKKIFLVCVRIVDKPVVYHHRFSCDVIAPHVWAITAYFGFKEIPDLNKLLQWGIKEKLFSSKEKCSVYFSKVIVTSAPDSALKGLRKKLFVFLSKNAATPQQFYKLPSNMAIELGIRQLL